MELSVDADLLKLTNRELTANSGGPPELTDLGRGSQRPDSMPLASRCPSNSRLRTAAR